MAGRVAYVRMCTHTHTPTGALRQWKPSDMAADPVGQAQCLYLGNTTSRSSNTHLHTVLMCVCVICALLYKKPLVWQYGNIQPRILHFTLHFTLFYSAVIHCILYLYIPMTSASHKAWYCGSYIRPHSQLSRASEEAICMYVKRLYEHRHT